MLEISSTLRPHPESTVTLTPQEYSLLKDFYQSFRHSQGNPDLQDHLAEYIARQYVPSDFGSMESLKERLGDKVVKLRFPKNHTNVTSVNGFVTEITPEIAQRTINGFIERWEFQLTVLGHVLGKRLILKPSYINIMSDDNLLNATTREILLRELHFQESGRPNRKDGNDPQESILRTYAFDKKTTGSSQFNKLYEKICFLLETSRANPQPTPNLIRGLLITLEKMWEYNHPGQKFLQPNPRG